MAGMTPPMVRIVEVGPRDGLQNIDKIISTDVKIDLIRRLAATGLQVIEATSFVSPKWIPQLADGGKVLGAIKSQIEKTSIRYPVLVPNVKGLEAASRAGAKEVGVFVSATEGFSQKNTNCSVSEALDRARLVSQRAAQLGIRVRGYVSCIFACPYDGITDPKQVLDVTKTLLDMGCFEVSLGDTLGVGTPAQVKNLLSVLTKDVHPSRLAGHFHDTYGQAVANAITAFNFGIRVLDSSVSGLGGCPYSPGARGNLASEDVVYAFEEMGVNTGIDLKALAQVGDWISREIGQANGSRAGAAICSKLGDKNPNQRTSKSETPKPGTEYNWELVDDAQEYLVYRSGHNVKIVLNRPKNGNALTANMLRKVAELFERMAEDRSVFHICLTANGKYFCTGMDLSSKGATSAGTAAEAKDVQFKGLVRLFEAIDNAPQTTIALINGPAFGGGVGLAFVCDIRLAKSDARFTLSEVKLGLCPATISKYIAREWGLSYAREAILTARSITASELYEQHRAIHGIAKNDEDLQKLLYTYMAQLKKCAPEASAQSKDLIRAAYSDAGGPQQAATIRSVYDWMMAPSAEAKLGSEQFRAGNRDMDWESSTMRSKLSKL